MKGDKIKGPINVMKFHSLLVGSGDSFMLEDSERYFLVDSGGSQEVLKSIITNPVDIAICTHNDADHSKGFIGLFKSNKHEIREIWLPGIWSTIIEYIKSNRYYVIMNEEIKADEIVKPTDVSELLEDVDKSIEEFTDELNDLDNYSILEHYLVTGFYPSHLDPVFRKIYFNLSRILEISRLAYERGAVIRWFFPNTAGGKLIKNFKPLNSSQELKMKKVRGDDLLTFLKLAYLTSENENSLTFEYLIENVPRVLFTADSIISKPKCYDDCIIVTAPHHGADSNKEVYKRITGKDLIWIRSDRPSGTRPCAAYLSLSNKYCLTCTKDGHPKKAQITFEFKGANWVNRKGIKCDH